MDWMWEGRERIWGLWLLEYLRMTSKLIALATREEGKLQMKWAVRMKISLLDLLFEISMTCKWKRSIDSWIYESWAQMRKAESQTFCLVPPGITGAHASTTEVLWLFYVSTPRFTRRSRKGMEQHVQSLNVQFPSQPLVCDFDLMPFKSHKILIFYFHIRLYVCLSRWLYTPEE